MYIIIIIIIINALLQIMDYLYVYINIFEDNKTKTF